MTTDQILAFAMIAAMMAAFIVDRFRYDLVACCALVISVAIGVVPAKEAFSGFSNDIVIIVGSALVVSAGVARSGIVDVAIKRFFPDLRGVGTQIALLLVVVAVLSAFIKNIGALAIMMPVAMQFARKTGVPVSRYLMPMAFAALLGGLMTQIGTSPNIVVSRIREEMTGQSFTMFDFTPVGGLLAVIGCLFLIFFHRILPDRVRQTSAPQEAMDIASYACEATVPADSPLPGKPLSDLVKPGDGAVVATTVLRGHKRMAPFPDLTLKTGDTVLITGNPAALDRVVSQGKLKLPGAQLAEDGKSTSGIMSIEAVVSRDSRLAGLSARDLALSYNHAVNLIALSRHGQRIGERLGELPLETGDVIVLQGRAPALAAMVQDFGLLPLAEREVLLGTHRRAAIPLAILAAAMAATAFGLAPVSVSFFTAALAMVLFGAVPAGDVYKSVDGPILVMLAALIPVSDSLRTTGASDIVAGWLGTVATGMPPYGALALILITAMAVTPFLNNAATVLVMGPIAASFATTLDFRPEAFLMAVAIGAGCDFLTPIGHQCNTLVMGPGGYRFSDYPRLGLPLSFLVILVSVPALMMVWPVS
ncbi:MAG: SLC13 family permease [Rhizobiales bacterium 63-7]|nr:SLC13 family permease [Hyphomicrobiales bacterium]OJU68770.1 MAG: SLC13 family permease [Rhizobiales bacterium 63-7]